MFKIVRALCVMMFLSVSAFAGPWLGLIYKKDLYENHLALRVSGVHPESGCLAAGVVSGDLVIGIDGKDLVNVAQLQNVLKNAKVGSHVAIEIFREGKRIPLTVTLTERPDDISSLTGSAIGSKIVKFGNNFYKNAEKRQEAPKATLLDFWATWCGPCRQTLPVLEKMYNKYSSQGLEVIGISSEQKNTLLSFYKKQHASPYPLYRDADQGLWRRYGIHAVPTLMLLDANGYIKRVWSGAPSFEMLEKLVLEVMEK
ncbi:MAG: redoxin domain-containing protein [Fibrobacter sp.]|uniref:thioredoxin-like domain-containing protein n=1 Tax=Fibrobacter sp. TaxID=35828 RepID=UPI0025C5F525|nr:thioredoxin-like domain-containing protein [Fibrobacter sp.]MBQ7080452.1 redoxin domain-containing protein [Fibrobacter sp.]